LATLRGPLVGEDAVGRFVEIDPAAVGEGKDRLVATGLHVGAEGQGSNRVQLEELDAIRL
jgi:hypothetical protein